VNWLERVRLGTLLLGDRLAAAAIQGRRVQAFVVQAENQAAALRAELDQRRLNPRRVALGLPRTAVTVKPIELPAVNGELDQMVGFELERHLPFPSEDAAFDFLPLPAPGAGAARHVLVAAAERRVVDSALRLAEEARLRPVSLTVAAHNLLALVAPRRRGAVLWVHGVEPDVELLFLSGAGLVFSRHLAAPDAAALRTELPRCLSLLRWRGVDHVWVSGDVTPELESALADLGPVAEPPYTARARRLLGALTESPRGVLELALATAAGGRVRSLELLPPALRPRRLTRAQLTTAALAAATVVLAVAALLAPGYRESRRLAALDAQIARLDPEVRATERLLAELERKRRVLATVQSIETDSLRPLPVLRELTDLLPNDAWLTMLSLDGKGVELTGQAAAAAALIPLLENSPRLERVEFSSPVTRGRDREQFRIRAAWEGGRPGLALAGGPAAGSAPAAPGPAAAPPAGDLRATSRPSPPSVPSAAADPADPEPRRGLDQRPAAGARP
jgi:Tfp pilus assembly protein PilN